MRKHVILLGVTLALAATVLTSCGENTNRQNNMQESSNSSNRNAMKKWAGTYVGSQGSAFTLSEDGKARVFCAGFFDDVDTDAIWSIEDDVLTIDSKEIGYEIYSNTQKADHNLMEFLSKNTDWKDEWFTKRKRTEKEYTKEDYLNLLDDTSFEFEALPRKEGYTYDEIQTAEYAGMTFDVPAEFVEEENEDEKEFNYFEDVENETVPVMLCFYNEKAEEAGDFREYKYMISDAIMEGLEEKSARLMDVRNAQVNGLDARLCTIYSPLGDAGTFYIRCAVIENGPDLFGIVMYQSIDSKYDYTVCYNDVLNSVRKSDSKDITIATKKNTDEEQKEENEEGESKQEEESDDKKNTSAGLRPEIKAAIDSYEEFMDEYIELMQEIGKNPSDAALLAKYAEFVAKSAEVSEKFEALDEDLTEEESLYYAEVALRVEGKMLKAMH